jgi:hypothetical protein
VTDGEPFATIHNRPSTTSLRDCDARRRHEAGDFGGPVLLCDARGRFAIHRRQDSGLPEKIRRLCVMSITDTGILV